MSVESNNIDPSKRKAHLRKDNNVIQTKRRLKMYSIGVFSLQSTVSFLHSINVIKNICHSRSVARVLLCTDCDDGVDR